jgi:hypothetical protein
MNGMNLTSIKTLVAESIQFELPAEGHSEYSM